MKASLVKWIKYRAGGNRVWTEQSRAERAFSESRIWYVTFFVLPGLLPKRYPPYTASW